MKKKMRTGNGGFTLIEVLLSIAILALISVPLIKYFTDSLGYSVKTQEKQNATLAAQQTIEFLKAQDALMKWQGAPNSTGTTVMHYNITDEIKEEFNVPLGMSIEDFDASIPVDASGVPEFDRNTGKGKLVYEYTITPDSYERGFDVRVTMATDKGATEIARPIVYGIDDTTNVVAAEANEEEEAIMYFLSLNAAAIIQQNGGYIIGVTPEPTTSTDPIFTIAPSESPTPDVTTTPAPFSDVDPQSEEDIKSNLRRTIHIDLDIKDEILGGETSTFYTVRVYYEYYCPYITSSDPTRYSFYTSGDLINTNVKTLEGIYLMFNKVHLTEDVIEIYWVGSDGRNPSNYPEFRFICQDIGVTETPSPDPSAGPTTTPAATTAPLVLDTYTPTIFLKNFTGGSEYQPTVRTNLEAPSTFLLDSSSQVSNKTLVVEKLTDSGNPVRVFQIVVEIFKVGDRDAGKDALIKMITSKTE